MELTPEEIAELERQYGAADLLQFRNANVGLPRTVRVLANDYTLGHLPEKECCERGVLGDTDINDCTIRLRETMSRTKLREVLLHEVMHALWDAMNLNEACTGKTLESDELPVNGLSVGLVAFARDNPLVAAFIFAHEHNR